MTLQEIADELVAGVRENRAKENLGKLYAPDAVSVEALDMGGGREVKGVDAIRAKHDWWQNTVEWLGGDVEGPFPHGDDRFAVYYTMHTRDKDSGKEHHGKEIGLYHVADGKIVREEFFYCG
tara:strand:- start:149 stop:514 length:366 start_codon:yes stop_codon:yes gene_type:complete